jgi:hypothetical protein
MGPYLITMLTYHDQTVQDALAVFDQCRDLPVDYWGFKDVGLPVREMKKLVAAMKDAGKTAFLEVVRYSEAECLASARLAVECGFNYLAGTIFYPRVLEVLKDSSIRYFPFCGKVSGSPSILEGTIAELIDEAREIERRGVAGFDLLAYRYVGDAEELARQFIRAVKVPVIMAGSIDSFERLDRVRDLGPWGFTIGSAFFDKRFVPGAPFREQIQKVTEYLTSF